MAFKMKYGVAADYIKIKSTSPRRRSGIKMPKVSFLVAHDTGNPGSTARNNVDYYKRTFGNQSTSAHIFVDDKEIIECVPALTAVPEKAWHVLYNKPTDNNLFGGDANDIAIGFELCYGGKVNNLEAYKRYVWVMAYACYKFKINPKTNIVSHSKLDPGNKVDPESALKLISKNMTNLIADIVKEYDECIKTDATVPVKPDAPSKPVTKPLEAKDMSKYFSDVPNDHYSAEHLDYLYEQGIISGSVNPELGKKAILGGFGQPITIERMATMLSRALQLKTK